MKHGPRFSIGFGILCLLVASGRGLALGQGVGGAATAPTGQSGTPGANVRVPAGPPQGFVLTPDQQARLDQILQYWEHRSSKINMFQCKFRRWEYNPAMVKDQRDPFTISDGEIKYAKPDKGLFRVDEMRHYTLPRSADGREIPGGKPIWERRTGGQTEHWICDGTKTIEFVPTRELVIERQLSPEQRGTAIADGPLPFLFGAEADKLKRRYWIREIAPPKGRQEYWIQVVPKTRDDAVNFELAEVILDAEEYLPSALKLYLPGGRESKVFQFSDRKVNDFVENLKKWVSQEFYDPKTPSGWKRVQEQLQPTGGMTRAAASTADSTAARR